MKKLLFLATLAVAAFIALDGGGGAKEEEAPPPDPAKALKAAIATGKTLFESRTIGTNGKSCATCHENRAKPALFLTERANTYPKWDKRSGRVILLGEKLDQMISRMLKGEKQQLGDERLVAFEAYLMSISRDK